MSSTKSPLGKYCACFPDSSVALQFVFEEPEFAEKIKFFENAVKKLRVRSEILPRVNFEVTRRLMAASAEAVAFLRNVRVGVVRIRQVQPDKIDLNLGSVGFLEEAVQNVIGWIRGQHVVNDRRFQEEARRARIVETALVSNAHLMIEAGGTTTLAEVIDQTMDQFADQYAKYSDKFSAFVNKIGATHAPSHEIPKPSFSLKKRLGAIVKNTWDIEVLCQAACRTIHGNRWSTLVSFDYVDLVKNQKLIEKETLVVVCDPIYVTSHVEQRLALNVTPREEARNRGLADADFLEDPSRMKIV